MKRLVRGLVGLALLGGLAVVLSGFIIAHGRKATFRAFDEWEAEAARLAGLLAEEQGEPFACSRVLTSKNPGKAFLGVIDYSGSIRGAEGVVLPFAFEGAPSVLYFVEGGAHVRPPTIEDLREYRTNPWATARSILRYPTTLKELVEPMPMLPAPLMDSDVAVTMLARAVEEAEGRVWLVADVAVTSTWTGELACHGRVELDLGEATEFDDLRVKRLSQAVKQLVTGPGGVSRSDR